MSEQSSIESVIFVCRAEANRLSQLVRDLEDGVEPRRLDGLLRELGKCADTLSGALARVSSYVDYLEGDATPPQDTPPPPADADLLQIINRMRAAHKFGICPTCNGIVADGGDHSRIENGSAPDDHAKFRARQRAYEVRR